MRDEPMSRCTARTARVDWPRALVECTYENDTDRTLHWGDSSLDEMCFVGLGLYPAIGYGQLPCSN